MSKIDLPTPDSIMGKVVCIRNIKNYPAMGYAYISVLLDTKVMLLFVRYPQEYAGFMEAMALCVPLHRAQFNHSKLTFNPYIACPCTSDYWTYSDGGSDL